MTGKELIIYILQNNLENERILNLITVDEAAAKYEVGPETVKAWCLLNVIPNIKLGNELYIIDNKEEKGDIKHE